MIHMKAIADTSRVYTVTAAGGTSLLASLNSIAAAGLLADAPMNVVVGEFQMTHGLNLALFNVVVRRPLGPGGSGPVALMIRTGAGLAFPHAETTVFRAVAHHYEFGGPAGQGAVGIEVRLPYRLSAVAEYKLTYAHLGLTTAHGTASMSALSHHISVGVTFALTHQ